jgi:hypothetical protein
MRDLDYTTLVTHGFVGFFIGAVGSGACYFISNFFARSVSSKPLGIYFIRLPSELILSMLWFVCTMPYAAAAHRTTNALRPEFWYGIAFSDGLGYGVLSALAWIIVALIDRPKIKHDKIQAA